MNVKIIALCVFAACTVGCDKSSNNRLRFNGELCDIHIKDYVEHKVSPVMTNISNSLYEVECYVNTNTVDMSILSDLNSIITNQSDMIEHLTDRICQLENDVSNRLMRIERYLRTLKVEKNITTAKVTEKTKPYCFRCFGRGYKVVEKKVMCKKCGGRGYLQWTDPLVKSWHHYSCNTRRSKCPDCSVGSLVGRGYIRVKEKVPCKCR